MFGAIFFLGGLGSGEGRRYGISRLLQGEMDTEVFSRPGKKVA